MAVGLGAWGFVVVWVTVVEVAFDGDGASVVVGSRWWRDLVAEDVVVRCEDERIELYHGCICDETHGSSHGCS
ncbi:hypothetical protein CTI12_AA463370 [Artemisia annua]|uniref:Secreted protein n=1 Tax=Artemisia annua TaxID=35608 RepID=A0A2U1LR59_ARTAN|nr:hypothetical protein CTI12_AA463370 [Artemisia annua]